MFELLYIFCHRFVSLSQLEELHLLSVFHTIREVLREELPPKCFPCDWPLLLSHNRLHASPPVFYLYSEHVHYKGKPALLLAHLGIKDPLHVLQLLVYDIGTGFAIELG